MQDRTISWTFCSLFLAGYMASFLACAKADTDNESKSVMMQTTDSIKHTTAIKPASKSNEDSPDYSSRGEQFVDLLAQAKYPKAFSWFDEKMAGALPVDKLQLVWESIGERFGPFKKRLKTQTMKRDRYHTALVFCQFKTKVVIAKVVFAGTKVAGLFFFPDKGENEQLYQAPDYADLKSFKEIEISIGNGKWKLPGTISMPNAQGPFPALVLVHGSGPHDRDESIGPNKPFRDIAWGLASKSIAVLRYEKRTKSHSQAMNSIRDSITTKDETTQDAALAVELLRNTKKIDPKRVFVLGHSLGGTLIPRIANLAPNAAGFIVMAGSTRGMEDLIVEQTEYILGLDGSLSQKDKKRLAEIKEKVKRVKDPNLSIKTPSEKLPFAVPAAYWLDLRGYTPAKAARSITKPILILQAGRDYQVTMEDFREWKKNLSKKSNATFKLYPKLNHLFMKGEGKSTPTEYKIPGQVLGKVIKDIAHWMITNGIH